MYELDQNGNSLISPADLLVQVYGVLYSDCACRPYRIYYVHLVISIGVASYGAWGTGARAPWTSKCLIFLVTVISQLQNSKLWHWTLYVVAYPHCHKEGGHDPGPPQVRCHWMWCIILRIKIQKCSGIIKRFPVHLATNTDAPIQPTVARMATESTAVTRPGVGWWIHCAYY